MSITLWKPEPDVLVHQALGKLAEECAELSQALARCLIQGYHEEEPVTHKLNRIQVREEVADVKAAMRWLSELTNEQWGESPREARKLAGFQQWQHMLEADPPATSLAPTHETTFAAEMMERAETCPICAETFKPDDLCATDIEMGTCHAACLEGSPVVDLNTGEETGGKVDTYPYSEVMEPSPASKDRLRFRMIGGTCSLADCPPGPFLFNGHLGFKTEYGSMSGKDLGDGNVAWSVSSYPDVYVMDSGEVFWGGVSSNDARASLAVQPVEILMPTPDPVAEAGE